MKQYRNSDRRRGGSAVVCALALLLASGAAAAAQKEQPPGSNGGAPSAKRAPAEADPKAPKAWSMRVSKGSPRFFTIKAKDAKLPEITAEMARVLKVPVKLSPVMENQRVTLDFTGLNLEATLRMLAPQAYVDYEAGGEDQYQPTVLAVYLNAFNETPPSLTATVKGNSEAILIEGDTEEGVADEETRRKKDEANPLKVSLKKNQVSVRARKQPLSVVLYKIASELGIPLELRYESPEIVDVEFTNQPIEQALRSLSPSVRLFYRADLQNFEIQPLRIALVAPASARS